MPVTRRQFGPLLLGGAAALAASSAFAQDSFPAAGRTLRLVIPFPPGGVTDLVSRRIAADVGAALGAVIVPDNRPGSNGVPAVTSLKGTPADGYTLFIGFLGTHATNASMYRNLPYDPVGEFTPIGLLVDAPAIVSVYPGLPIKTLDELIAYLPRGLPLIKRVLALGGATVCRRGSAIIAYDGIYGQALARDRRGRPLPDWQGCRTLHDGEAFFMNWDTPDSFDSRYFGPLPVITIVGRAIPVWTTDDSNPAAESIRAPVSDEP